MIDDTMMATKASPGSALVGSLSAIAYAAVFASLSHGTTGAKAAFIMALQKLGKQATGQRDLGW